MAVSVRFSYAPAMVQVTWSGLIAQRLFGANAGMGTVHTVRVPARMAAMEGLF